MPPPPRLWDDEEEHLIRYLLGRLSPEEEMQIEERVFVEPGFHDELQATSDDLIRAYLVGRLPAEDRTRFDEHFLASARRRERFDFLKDVLGTIQEASGQRRGSRVSRLAVSPWLAAAALVLIAAGLYFTNLRRPPRGDHRADGPATPTPNPTAPPPTATPVPEARPRPTTAPRATAARPETRLVRLPPAADRPVEMALAEETRTVRLEVPLEGPRHPTYDAEIRGEDGEAVWQAKAILPRGPGEPLVLEVPTRVLVADAYELRVSGERLRGMPPGSARAVTYTLRITRRATR
jgi:hypothetical protein